MGNEFDQGSVSQEMFRLITDLYPICRSITGNGMRQSLRMLQAHIPLELHEVPTGTPVFDWTVPQEWNIRDAYIKDSQGVKVVDFQASSLHVVNYSVPVHQVMALPELKTHLFSIPEQPALIPYRTSYYHANWGFCLSHELLESLEDGDYEVYIDASLTNGSLTYGEYYLAGEREDEILISCHCCHPSLCNDNLSGMALATYLAKYLGTQQRHYSYRFLFIPGTIGSITWLALHQDQLKRIKHGLVVACVGDAGGLTYKQSRQGNAEIDRAASHILAHSGQPSEVVAFSPYGYDERQYCSPGINLPVGSLSRTPHGRFPEYHTSADNLHLISPHHLADTLEKAIQILDILEKNRHYLNTNPHCEPQLGRRGLYGAFGGKKDQKLLESAMLWVLNFSDREHTLLEIAERAEIPFSVIWTAATALCEAGLLIAVEPVSSVSS
jgi:aminopeptidase-like protein